MVLIKNVEVYAPEYLGVKDVLVSKDKIEYVGESIEIGADMPKVPCEIIDGTGKKLIPGLIDQHVHVTGGGGEGGFATRAPEMQVSEMISNGITTVVGLLGTDGVTRSVENLYAKTMALNEEGVTAYMLTGSYDYPSPTITGSIEKDLIFIHNVLGVKLALSDHRAPNVTVWELMQIASKMRVHGMLSGKPGFVCLHMGGGRTGFSPIGEVLEHSEVPIKTFRPTHVNRNPKLLSEGYEFLAMGGYIDLTCGMEHNGEDHDKESMDFGNGIKIKVRSTDENLRPGCCVMEAKRRRLPLERITMSSDGHGSWSNYDKAGNLLEIGIASMDALYNELKYMVQELELPLEEALPFMTSNVADGLGLAGKKGRIQAGADGDLVLLSEDMSIDMVFARGQIMMQDGVLLRKGTYER